MHVIAAGVSARLGQRMRSTRSMKPIGSCTPPASPKSCGRRRRAARARRSPAARLAGSRFGATTRKPVPLSDSSASARWTIPMSAFCTSILTSSTAPATAGGLSCKTASNWLGTLRARFGYAWDRVLVYGTAGGAGANIQTALTGLPYQTNPEFGWTVGGGIEVAFAEHWTFKAEYLFVDLGNASCNHGYSCGFDVAGATAPVVINAVNSNNAVKTTRTFSASA